MDYSKMAEAHPKLSRGQVWCMHCGATRHVNTADCLRNGWPKCCGFTMTIDSPQERGMPEEAQRGE